MNALLAHKTLAIKLLIAGIGLVGCSKSEVGEPTAREWSWVTPLHFPEPVYQFDKLAYSEDAFELGKKLFFDPRLSRDNTISCGSCHHQSNAFSDPGKALSVGIDDQLTTRHSPALINLAWQSNFMWDGGINHLDLVPFSPITNPFEMDERMLNILGKLNADNTYQKEFYSVFGDTNIDDQKMLLVLTQYMVSLVSVDSKYDEVMKGKSQFNTLEQKGYELFTTHCNTCHTAPLFHANNYANNGLDDEFSDVGRYLITQNPADSGKFKVPTLRNIALTAPYMHDGRFYSLEEVMNHYRFGIQSSKTLSGEIPHNGFTLSDEESDAIIAFLETLTDEVFVTEEKFQP